VTHPGTDLEPKIWYFAFYPRRKKIFEWWGHVDMWGVTRDDTWVFLDPARAIFQIQIAHKSEEVNGLMAERFANAEMVLRYTAAPIKHRLPPLGFLTCASICGHTIGLRAWTPLQLKRKLLRNGAEIV
jgi:hypothetical protein